MAQQVPLLDYIISAGWGGAGQPRNPYNPANNYDGSPTPQLPGGNNIFAGSANVELGTEAYAAQTGNYADYGNPQNPQYKAWVLANIPQAWKDQMTNARGTGPNAAYLSNGMLYIPDSFANTNESMFELSSDSALGVLAIMGTAALGSGAAMGALGGAGAGAGGFAAGDAAMAAGAMGGAAGPSFGGLTALEAAGGLSAAGGFGGATGGADWWTELGLTPADVGMDVVGPWTTNPGIAELTGGVLTNAGGVAGGLENIINQVNTMPGGSSILSKIMNGTATETDWLSAAGKLISTGLGMFGSNQQSNQLSDLAKQYQEYGAPSRARYEASMASGFDPSTIPGFAGAIDSSMSSMLRGLSTEGNPFGNPGALMEANNYVAGKTALPALQNYQSLNANTGFVDSMNGAMQLQQQAIGSDANSLNALGYGLNALTNNQPSLADLLRQAQGGWNLNNGMPT